MENEKNTVSVAYRPGVGDPETMEAYGRRFKAGEFVELPQEFSDRARTNPSFEVQGEKSFGDKDESLIIPDDPNYPKDAGTEADLTFEELVELQTAKEYGTTDPELAEQIRVARQHGRDSTVVSRLEAEAAIKRKRGRPRKTDTPPVDEETAERAAKIEADQSDIERQQEAERDASRQREERLAAARAELAQAEK